MKKEQIPQWECHKKVRAFKIHQIVKDTIVGGYLLAGEPHPTEVTKAHHVSDDYFKKHCPAPGGYYVQYEDGYESYSPAKAFENGYTKVA